MGNLYLRPNIWEFHIRWVKLSRTKFGTRVHPSINYSRVYLICHMLKGVLFDKNST
jgi:hypothetical protein